MIIDVRIVVKRKKSGVKEYLIKCDTCGNQKWYSHQKCFGRNRFCSRSCSKIGKKHSEEWKQKMSERNSGCGNPFYGKTHDDETRRKMSESTKAGLSNMTPEDKELMKMRHSISVTGEKNHFYGKTHNDETRCSMSRTRAAGIAEGRIFSTRGLKGWYFSHKMNENFYHDSFFELIRMKMLDASSDVHFWTKKHGIIIPYSFHDVNRYYVPDFLIKYEDGRMILEEIKGYEEPEKLSAKMLAFAEYCTQYNFEFRFIDATLFEQMTFSFYGKKINQLRNEFINELKKCAI